MPFVTGAMLEGELEAHIEEPSFSDVQNLVEQLLRAGRGTLTLEGTNDVQLSLSLSERGSIMVDWHCWDSGESFVVVSPDHASASAAEVLDGAEYPAREFVAPTVAIAAARRFFDDGARDPSLAWEPPGAAPPLSR